MKKLFFYFILILLLILAAIYGKAAYNFIRFMIAAQPDFTKVEFHSKDYNETIYLKKKIWGLTGDHQIIVISQSSKNKCDDNNDLNYVFEGLSPFYYSYDNDTLTVYVRKKTEIPEKFNSNIFIKQVELDNVEMLKLMEMYKELELKEFSR